MPLLPILSYGLWRLVNENTTYFLGSGLASTIKQVAVVNIFWVATYLLVSMWRAKDKDHTARSLASGCWVAGGSVIPWLPFLVYFALHGALSKFYFWVVSANFHYINVSYGAFSNLFILLHVIT